MTIPQPWPVPPPVRARTWPAVALSVLAVVLATAALIVALTQSGSGSGTTYTAAQRTEAKTQLCARYKLAGHALNIETQPGNDVVLARMSMINGAVILETAATDPALDLKYRDAALSLAKTYQTTAAIGTTGMATPDQWQAAVDDTNTKDRVMQELCGD